MLLTNEIWMQSYIRNVGSNKRRVMQYTLAKSDLKKILNLKTLLEGVWLPYGP